MTEKIKICLVDDHPVVREGLKAVLKTTPNLVLCGEAEDEPGALEMIKETQPDLVLLDLMLKKGAGLSLCAAVARMWPAIKILVMSGHSEDLYGEKALQAGASGYVMKDRSFQDLMAAIRAVLAGKLFFTEKFMHRVLRDHARESLPPAGREPKRAKLTSREDEVFTLIGKGLTVARIAHLLGISEKTVETHRLNIREKVGVGDMNELVCMAIRRNLMEEGGLPQGPRVVG
jgi:two-component system, NarL family, response regulator NreC